jgi:hypothetical protein
MSSLGNNHTIQIDDNEREIEIELDNIRTHLTSIHEKAAAIGSELRVQEGIIDESNVSMEESLQNLNQANKKIVKLTDRNVDKAKCLCLLLMTIAVVVLIVLLVR